MPKLWEQTIASHRRAVRDSILDAVAARVADRGLPGLRMSHLAETTGIGRATLYGYFADLDAVLLAWHERQVARHLAILEDVGARPGAPRERLKSVLETFARMAHGHPHGTEIVALLHDSPHVSRAQEQLHSFLRDLIAEGARTGHLRDDVPADELASFSLHALTAAGGLRSKAAAARLVDVTLSALLAPAAPSL